MLLFHLLGKADWAEAQRQGSYTPASLSSEGFIHLSLDRQLLRSAEKYFAGRDDLLVLFLDSDKLKANVKFDPVESDAFPHLYGPLNLDAVTKVSPLMRGADGRFLPL